MKTTKFLNLLLLAVLCLGFASCSDDDDDENTYNDSIVGTWVVNSGDEIIEIETNYPKFAEAYLKYGGYHGDGHYNLIDGEITFNKDNKYKAFLTPYIIALSLGSVEQNGEKAVMANDTIINNKYYDVFDNNSYTNSDSILTIESPYYTDPHYVKYSVQINGNVATFKEDLTEDATLNYFEIHRNAGIYNSLDNISDIDSIQITKYIITRTATRK